MLSSLSPTNISHLPVAASRTIFLIAIPLPAHTASPTVHHDFPASLQSPAKLVHCTRLSGQAFELLRSESLVLVRHRLLWLPVHLHDKPDSAASGCSQAHGLNQTDSPGPVARVCDDREVRQLLC